MSPISEAQGSPATLYEALVGRHFGSSHGQAIASVAAIVVGSLLMTLAAKLTVPFFPVPLSMQTFVAIGLGLALGPVRGAAAVVAYLAQGAAGLPVFAGTPEKGIGLLYMAGPTGGFLLGFVIQAFVAGAISRRDNGRNGIVTFVAALAAAAAIYPIGIVWLGAVVGFDKPVLALGLYPFIVGDVAKALLAALVFPLAWRASGR